VPLRVLFNPINREIFAEKGDILLDRMQEEGARDQGIIRLLVDGPPRLGKRLLLEKISVFLLEDGFVVSEPKKHENVDSCLSKLGN